MKNSNGKLYVCIDERASSKAHFDRFGDGSLTLNKWMQQSRDDDLLEGPQYPTAASTVMRQGTVARKKGSD